MSGTVGNNILRHSGSIAVTAAGLSWDTAVVTASTVTVVAGNGYWINTTSNACTITLPASAEAGDQIVIVDYARTWGTNAVTIDSNGLTFQGDADTFTVEYTTDGQSVNLIYSDSTKGWLPLEDDVVADEPVQPQTQRALFAYGRIANGDMLSLKNLVNSSGVVAADVSGVGTARGYIPAATYGTDKAIFAFGYDNTNAVNTRNLVNNSGVIAANATGAGTAKFANAGTGYGDDKAIFYGGRIANGTRQNTSNLVTNEGVVGTDVTGVGTARGYLTGVRYGTSGQALFTKGNDANGGNENITNLVNNSGVISANVSGVGTARYGLAASTYGVGLAAIAYGYNNLSVKNLVNTSGVIGADVTGVGTGRSDIAAAGYGGDKGIFAYGGNVVSLKNLLGNNGVIAADVTGVGTARKGLGAAGYSLSA